jgi:Do/DeqQ family serine protease
MKRLLSLSLAVLLAAVVAPGAHAAVPLLGGIPTDSRGLPTLAPMLSQVTAGVVNISVTSRDPAESNPLLRDPFFRRFFNIPESQARPQQSAGSGVIVDAARGLVLTNHHVIKDAQEVVVTLKDRRELKARLVGADPGTDVALLRISPDRLTAVRLGDSENINVGDFVVAIGNPFGIGQTVTSGIVSALGRTGLGIEGYEEFIQTDASINPGNSGGALVNLRGELIGINTAILGPSGGNVGIGFAIPVNMVRAVMDQLLRFGEVRRGRIGVATDDLTPDLAKKLGLSVTEGALVVVVEPNSAALRAGLKARDIIVGANGKPVRNSTDVRNRTGLTPVGEEIDLRILRGGQTLSLKVKVAEPFVATNLSGEAVPQLVGAKVSDIEPGMPMHGSIEGAIIVGIENGSAAAQVGLQPGDIIYGVNRRRVHGVKDLLAALRAGERPMRILLLRGENRLTLTIR